jgi:hypothetical protein
MEQVGGFLKESPQELESIERFLSFLETAKTLLSTIPYTPISARSRITTLQGEGKKALSGNDC